jgi:hypothetical protein
MNSMTGYRGPAGGNLATRQAGNFKGDIIPKGYKQGQLAQFTPEQMQLFQQLFSNVGPESFLSRLGMGEEGGFEQAEAPAWKQFAEAQGQLGSRFSQLAPGAMSAQRGSGFQNQAGQLGSDFAMNLASRRQELQRQALMDLMGLSQSLLGQRPYERGLFEKPQHQPSTSSQFGLGALNALGGTGASYARGGI